MGKLAEVEGLLRVVEFCSTVPTDDVHVLGSGMAIFANVAFQGYAHLVTDARAHSLIVRLLCPPTASTDASVLSFAQSALQNLCADGEAAAALSTSERSSLLNLLKGEVGSDQTRAATRQSLQALHKLSARQASGPMSPIRPPWP